MSAGVILALVVFATVTIWVRVDFFTKRSGLRWYLFCAVQAAGVCMMAYWVIAYGFVSYPDGSGELVGVGIMIWLIVLGWMIGTIVSGGIALLPWRKVNA